MRWIKITIGVAIAGILGFLGIREVISDPIYFLELVLGGLTRGSIYALIALGYTMVYGIIQLINFAHGEIYMIGAITALIVASVLGLWGWNAAVIAILAVVFAVVYSCAYGFTVEKIAYKPLRTAPRLSALIS
ncbi:MAG: branched-chain amino acid ABC transporter permease LivH, partial [Proteobacteria bacterium]|nr:branched-chain amino acid ABC transporter permease LivH [Pseudomonadota bacterium]